MNDVKSNIPTRFHNSGTQYLEFFSQLNSALRPRGYFEIGVNLGKSFTAFSCPSVGVDPQFILRGDVIGQKPAAHFFQLPSDIFFQENSLFTYFPNGFDLAFLDGMHLFEFLLRDFINSEPYAGKDAIILLHDCLPINAEMAERERNPGGRKDQELKSYWTGDVWKLVPILRKYRPDLKVSCLNCAPTGVVAIQYLNSESRVLQEHYSSILAEYLPLLLDDDGLRQFHAEENVVSPEEFLSQVEPFA